MSHWELLFFNARFLKIGPALKAFSCGLRTEYICPGRITMAFLEEHLGVS